MAVPLFAPGGRSFVPACACRCAARKGRQGWPSRWPCPLASVLPGPRLDGPRARREDHAGRDAIASVLTNSKARPLLRTAHAMRASLLASAMASTLVVQSLLGRFNPRFEPIALPLRWPDQHDPGGLNEQ